MNLKVIIGLLVGLLVIQIVGAAVYFLILLPRQSEEVITELGPTSSVIETDSPGKGFIALQTDTATISVNDDVAVNVFINTDSRPVEGIDLSLKYDPEFVEPVVVNNLPFVPARLFPDVPLNSFNNRLGVASMSAVTSLEQNYSGEGILAQITFKAKKAGKTMISIQAEPESTTDSNMVSNGQEMLSRVENLEITISK